MSELDDHQLLAEFARDHSEPAFAALVHRHLNLVHATALRSLGQSHAAEEVASAVFIILAQKAGKLSARVVLSGWLYQTARLTAANYLRGEIRRQKREQEAYMQSTLNGDGEASSPAAPETIWPQIAPLLDDALARLGATDRNAIVLRFLEDKSLAEVGAALGASEDAAKMRVNRALEKLRKIFSKRGVTLSAMVIAGAVSSGSACAAPAGLAATISAVAVTKGAAASSSTLALVKGALKIMAWTKVKTALVVGAGVLLATGTATVTVLEIRVHETYSWQSRNANSDVLRRVPPQVKIAPAKYPGTMGAGKVSIENGKTMGVSQSAKSILATAYDQSPTRILVSGSNALPSGKYDFIANLPGKNREALQGEIKRKFGVVGRWERQEIEVLLLKIHSVHAPGLMPADPGHLKPNTGSSGSSGVGYCSYQNGSMLSLAWFLEDRFNRPVIDFTGLTNRFDFDLKWSESDYQHPNLPNLKQALLDQLGLELVPGREPLEMLVVEKVK